jgi:site-specific recombinase XerD
MFGNCLEMLGNLLLLFDLTRMNVSIYLIHCTRRKKQNDKYPVKLRVTHLRKTKDFPILLDLTEVEYEEATAKRPKKEYQEIAIKLAAALSKANKVISDIGIFTFQKFENAYSGRIKDASDIFPIFEEYIDNIRKEDRLKTASSYESAKKSIQSFQPRISFYDITPSFLKEYQAFQLEKKIGKNMKTGSSTTVGIYVRSLRSVYNYAISLGIIKKDETYPFGKRQFTIPAGRNVKKALTAMEVKKIFDFKTSEYSPTDKAKDFWMLSFLCNGINFKDICLLQNKNIDGDMLRFVRAKTKNSTAGSQTIISCHLTARSMVIIEKWRNSDRVPNAYLFPILSKEDSIETQMKKIAQLIKNTNKYMKVISENTGQEKVPTTYFSRHSAATILKRSGASIQQIQEALGHQNASTTQKYLDSFDDESKKDLAARLSDFL